MGSSTEKFLGTFSVRMKGLLILQLWIALASALPQHLDPRQVDPRGTCANLPGFVGNLNRIVGGKTLPMLFPGKSLSAVQPMVDVTFVEVLYWTQKPFYARLIVFLTSMWMVSMSWLEKPIGTEEKTLQFPKLCFTILPLGIRTLWTMISSF